MNTLKKTTLLLFLFAAVFCKTGTIQAKQSTDAFVAGVSAFVATAPTAVVQPMEIQDFYNLKYYMDADNQLHLKANKEFQVIEIYSVIGQRVFSQRLSNKSEIINVSDLKTGIYIANVTIEGEKKSFKIVKK